RVLVPEANAAEAELVEGAEVVGVRSLRHATALLTGTQIPEEPPVSPLSDSGAHLLGVGGGVDSLNLREVAGQADARGAVIVAAAGGHHGRLTGPPGPHP